MSVVSEGNGTLVIALPSGMTGQQYLNIEAQLGVVGICIAAGFAIILWDYLITFRDEWALYTSSTWSTWKQPSTWAYIVLRYASIFASLPSLWFSTSLQTTHCSFVVRLASFAVAVVVAAAGLIFVLRVSALWNRNKLVYGILGFFYLVLLCGWFGTAWTYDASTGPPAPFGSNCILHPTAKWNSVSFGSSVLFDCVVLVLTVLKVRPHGDARSAVVQRLFHDSVLYFAVTAATNIVVLVVNALGPRYALLKPAVEPFSTVATTTMAQRVFVNLKLMYAETSTSRNRSTTSLRFSRMAVSAPRLRDPFGMPAIRIDGSPRAAVFPDGVKVDGPYSPGMFPQPSRSPTLASFAPEVGYAPSSIGVAL